MRISDWSSDVCSSDLVGLRPRAGPPAGLRFLPLSLRTPPRRACAAVASRRLLRRRVAAASPPRQTQDPAPVDQRSRRHRPRLVGPLTELLPRLGRQVRRAAARELIGGFGVVVGRAPPWGGGAT